MQFLGSVLFTLLFFVTTAVFGVLVLAFSWLPIHKRYALPRAWARTLFAMLKLLCRLDYTVEGRENLPKEPFISMWKHSSTWDTIAQMIIVPPASWILKREVTWIPIVGWAVATFRPIAINRSAGGSAVKQVVAEGRKRFAEGLGVLIYPEGTRMAPGETRKYGVSGALLATQTGRLIVPIAHNSGYFWRRRGLMKLPGTIRVVIGPPIDPAGLDPREVNDRAQRWIEATVAEIVARPGGRPE
jgi:1-acyl-sn-glycerol-3-phosphate acyltransferase